MKSYVAILAIFCLLVGAVGAAGECGACIFSTASNGNDCPACVFASDPDEVKCPACVFASDPDEVKCPACVFASDPDEVKCPACVFGDPPSLNGCSACEFSIHVAGDGYSTYQVSGNHIQYTMVYHSPSAALFVPDAVSRGYMGYDPADLPSRSTRQQYFAEAAGLSQHPGNQQVADRFERIFSTSSGFSQFL
ncbi:MAG: hypothetical protein WC382_04915 [Methanoregulaceae archaeon]